MQRLVLAAICGASILAPCRADEFCDALKTVVAAAPNDFATIKGRPSASDARIYVHPLQIPGARWPITDRPGCVVQRFQDATPRYVYSCSFTGGGSTRPELHSALAAFTLRVASCLGIKSSEIDRWSPPDRNPLTASDMGTFPLPYSEADMSVGLTLLPDGGDGILSISVAKAK